MRISYATYLVSAAILLVASVFTIVLIWASGLLKEPYEVVDNYNRVRQEVTIGFRGYIQCYFESGDATKLHEAEKLITGVKKQLLPKLPPEIAGLLAPSITKLDDAVKTKLRGSGKQGADPQMLLKNAERQMQGEIDSIVDYSREGRGHYPEFAYDYLLFSNDLNMQLQKVIAARQDLIALQDSRKKEMIEDYLGQMSSILKKIENLPGMGIYEEAEEDDFASLMGGDDSEEDETEQVDKIDAYLSQLNSLINRYLNDIETTQRQVATVEESKALVESVSNEVDEQIKKADQQILTWRNRIEEKVFSVFTIIIGVMFIMALATYVFLSFGVLKPLRLIAQKMHAISQGDANLKVRLQIKGRNELTEVGDAFNLFVEKVGELVEEVKGTAEQLHIGAGKANEMARVSKDKVVDQQQRTTQIAAAMHEMSATIEEIRSNSVRSDGIVSETNQRALGIEEHSAETSAIFDQLASEISRASSVIQTLAEDSKKVETVMDVIREIAEQTNLLALNAAIEAARAGDNGRGFAVVADEVRILAQRTQNSIEEIRQIIDSLLGGANNGAEVMQKSADKMKGAVGKLSEITEIFTEITVSIGDISQMTASIATATEEQSYGVAEIAQNVEGIKELSDSISDNVIQAADANAEMNRLTDKLDGLVKRFD